MSTTHEFSPREILFDADGVMITDSHVRTQKKTYALSGSAFCRVRSSESLDVDDAETARLRRLILPWGLALGLLAAAVAALSFSATVQAQFYLAEGRELGVWPARGIAFGLAATVAGLALTGVILCARVQRKYRLYHVYLDTRQGRREIAVSRNEARISAIAAALDKAIARLSVASTEPPLAVSTHPPGLAPGTLESSSQPAA